MTTKIGYVIPPPEQTSLAVMGTKDRFPVRRIYCVGRNYLAHVLELGNDAKEPPFFFCKPADAIVEDGATMPFPLATQNLHFEAELVVALEKGGTNLSPDQARDCIYGYAAGIDLTRRDLQSEAKEKRRAWDMAKGFDQSAPIGNLTRLHDLGRHLDEGRIHLTQNGEVRQDSALEMQIWDVPHMLSYLSKLVALAPGDLVMTGTPDGVGPIQVGDTLVCEIEGLDPVRVTFSASLSAEIK